MKILSRPAQSLKGSVRLPGDKSISHRAALLAAMAEGQSRVEGFLRAGVTQVMLDSLSAAHVAYRWEGETLVVEGKGRYGFQGGGEPLSCGHSATTIRLMAGALSGRPSWQEGSTKGEFILDGSPQLRRRPMGRVIEPLRRMGAEIRSLERPECAPLAIVPTQLHGIKYRMPVASAQVKSALLLAGLSAHGATTVEEPSPSRDHTERFLRSLGVSVEQKERRVCINPIDRPLPAFSVRVPGDFSSAAFLIVAASITRGSEILLQDVGLNPRRTGLLGVLRRMGADIEEINRYETAGEPVGDIRIRSTEMKATVVEGAEVVDMIDEFPVFAVAAALAEGRTLVRQAEELRHKESDRISMLCAELRKIGVEVEESADGFAIRGPAQIRGGVVNSHGDHRLAMSMAVVGLVSKDGVEINGAECIAESFPTFIECVNSLGAAIG